jgi:hypothetical protein
VVLITFAQLYRLLILHIDSSSFPLRSFRADSLHELPWPSGEAVNVQHLLARLRSLVITEATMAMSRWKSFLVVKQPIMHFYFL